MPTVPTGRSKDTGINVVDGRHNLSIYHGSHLFGANSLQRHSMTCSTQPLLQHQLPLQSSTVSSNASPSFKNGCASDFSGDATDKVTNFVEEMCQIAVMPTKYSLSNLMAEQANAGDKSEVGWLACYTSGLKKTMDQYFECESTITTGAA